MGPALLAHMVDPTEVQRRKTSVRRDSLARRDALEVAERVTASIAIAHRVIGRIPSDADTVGLYANMGSEVDTAPLDGLLRARGLRVVYPRVTAGVRALTFHETKSIADLVPTGRLQIREPGPSAETVALADIAMFVIPGIAFDARGARVGWGRGHYDATLAGLSAELVGIAFDCQIVASAAIGFAESHDIHMHAVVTERMTYVRVT
jgi:5-formyltetrahydrofolate cyclo-ligase